MAAAAAASAWWCFEWSSVEGAAAAAWLCLEWSTSVEGAAAAWWWEWSSVEGAAAEAPCCLLPPPSAARERAQEPGAFVFVCRGRGGMQKGLRNKEEVKKTTDKFFCQQKKAKNF